MRGKVKAVLAGLRFGDGNLPFLDDLAAAVIRDGRRASAGFMLGKASWDESEAVIQALMVQTAVIKAKDDERVFVVHLKERWADLPLQIGA